MANIRFLYDNKLDTTGVTITASSTVAAQVTQAQKNGTGSGSCVPGGVYTGTTERTYLIIIDTAGDVGAATFKWSSDGGSTFSATGVATSSSPITLDNGITVYFTVATGTDFVLGDRWDFKILFGYGTAKLIDRNRNTEWRSAEAIAVLVASGAVTQANTRISAVANLAFVDFTAADVLTGKLGHELHVVDSAGAEIIGVIKAVGTAETVTEINADTGFDTDAYWDKEAGWTIAGSKGVAATTDSYQIRRIETLVVGRSLYKTLFTISDRVSGGAGICFTGIPNTQGTTRSANGTYTEYLTANANSDFGIIAGGASTLKIDDYLVGLVSTPSTTGVTITTQKGGTVYSWFSQDAGFNYNDAAGYTYEIWTVGKEITIDLLTPQTIQTLLIWDHNFTNEPPAITLAGDSVPNWGAPAFGPVAITWASGKIVYYLPPGTPAYRYWQLSITNAANTDGYLRISNLFLGPYTATTQNFAYGWTRGRMPYIAGNLMGLHPDAVVLGLPELLACNFPLLPDADRDALVDTIFPALYSVSTKRVRPCWIHPDPSVANDAIMGYWENEALAVYAQSPTAFWDLPLQFRELVRAMV